MIKYGLHVIPENPLALDGGLQTQLTRTVKLVTRNFDWNRPEQCPQKQERNLGSEAEIWYAVQLIVYMGC